MVYFEDDTSQEAMRRVLFVDRLSGRKKESERGGEQKICPSI